LSDEDGEDFAQTWVGDDDADYRPLRDSRKRKENTRANVRKAVYSSEDDRLDEDEDEYEYSSKKIRK